MLGDRREHKISFKAPMIKQGVNMAFWDLETLQLEKFKPGILSKAQIGENLIMVCMEINPGNEDTGHTHPYDQCGIVVGGEIELTIGDQQRRLKVNEAYFIPAGIEHGWKSFDEPVRLLDVSLTQ